MRDRAVERSYYFFPGVCVVLMLLSALTYSQATNHDLIANGGFELYNSNSQAIDIRHFDQVTSWRSVSWQSFYCNCQQNIVPYEWYISHCDFDKYTPHSGKGMVKMIYEEAWSETTKSNNCADGCTAYIQTALNTPLELGEVYEISMWVNYPSAPVNLEAEPGIMNHIGFVLSLDVIGMSDNNMLDMDQFFSAQIEFDKWVRIRHFIRALCPLKTITLGLFRNRSFPVQKRLMDDDLAYPFYFIDDVSVVKVSPEIADTILATPFCRFFEDEAERLEVPTDQSIELYYSTNSSALTEVSRNTLDSFLVKVDTRWKPVYEIVGHTDDTGSENEALSCKRINEVSTYLKEHHQIPEFRTIGISKASRNPIGDNKTLDGKALNRRVDVRISSLSHSAGIYRQVLNNIDSNNLVDAFVWLNRWLNSFTGRNAILVYFDPRVQKLKGLVAWSTIDTRIRETYKRYRIPDEAFFLDSMYCEDQRYRTLEPMLYSLTGFIEGHDTFDFSALNATWDVIQEIDTKNKTTITNYLDSVGFPSISEVGRGQVKAIIYVLMHSEDTEWLGEYLPIIRDNCVRGEAEWHDYAMAYDKHLRLKALPQQYGTQLEFVDEDKTTMMIAPIDDLNLVNSRRKQIGLSALSDEALQRKVMVKQ